MVGSYGLCLNSFKHQNWIRAIKEMSYYAMEWMQSHAGMYKKAANGVKAFINNIVQKAKEHD
jgi:hypothetical protein